MSHTPVLIVGAGPTGLLMACELARHGIAFRIIDKKPEQTLTSNAAGIQTRSIELFDEIGMLDRLLKEGLRCNGIAIYFRGKPLTKILFDNIDSLYPYILMLPQSDTERLLSNRLTELGNGIERPLELISVKQLESLVEVEIKHPDGQLETVTTDWLVACDGARSVVREQCQIHFPGQDLPEQFIVADAKMSSFLRADEIHVFLNKGTLLATFPINPTQYRLAANLHLGYARKIYTEKEVKEIVADRVYGNYNADSVTWISPFWIHSKVVNQLRANRVFLAGDAAHIHSPAGGQGMNTGLQDAQNLAWKLALVVKHKAHSNLLDSYQAERLPVVETIVKVTEAFTKLALTENSLVIWLRNWVYRLVQSCPALTKKLTMRSTQLGISYQKSPVIDYQQVVSSRSPRPGERAPDVMLDGSRRLKEYFNYTFHPVLLFLGESPTQVQIDQIKELQQWVIKTYPDIAEVHLISKDKIANAANLIVDIGGAVHKRYHVTKPSIYIIRPDNYIAGCSGGVSQEFISSYFGRFLL